MSNDLLLVIESILSLRSVPTITMQQDVDAVRSLSDWRPPSSRNSLRSRIVTDRTHTERTRDSVDKWENPGGFVPSSRASSAFSMGSGPPSAYEFRVASSRKSSNSARWSQPSVRQQSHGSARRQSGILKRSGSAALFVTDSQSDKPALSQRSQSSSKLRLSYAALARHNNELNEVNPQNTLSKKDNQETAEEHKQKVLETLILRRLNEKKLALMAQQEVRHDKEKRDKISKSLKSKFRKGRVMKG